MTGVAVIASFLAIPFAFSNLFQELRYVKAQTAEKAAQGAQRFSDAKNGLSDFRMDEAGKSFQEAFAEFHDAEKSLQRIHSSLFTIAKVLPGKGSALSDGKMLVSSGEDLAQAGTFLARAGSAFQPPFQLFDKGFLTSFEAMNNQLKEASPYLHRAAANMADIHVENIPVESQAQFSQTRKVLESLSGNIDSMTSLGDSVVRLLGKQSLKRYLIVFQNNTELRATGGFIGSYALVDFANGKLRNIEIPPGGPYDLQGSLQETVVSPEPLHIVNPKWQFQDANWFPDFPTSAKKVNWFWSHAGQPTLDGVIAVNESLMEKLLTVTGPIDMPEYGKTITAENFLLETQKAVELEYDKTENKPKKFIGDLMPKLLEKLKQGTHDQWLQMISLMADAL